MKAEKNFYQKVKELVFPPGKAGTEDAWDILPFYLMVTAAMVWMYLVYVRQIDNLLNVIIFSLLMLIHAALYWGVFRFVGNQRNMRRYFVIQALLAFVIVLFADDYGLAIGLYASLIGNAVGALQDKKDLLYFVPGFLVLGAFSIMLKSGMDVVMEWSLVALPSILLSSFIAFMFRRQLEIRFTTQALLDDLREAHVQLEDYAEQVEELTLADERQRMARELHDTLAQELTGVVLQLEAVSTHIEKENNARAQEILQDAMVQSRVTLAEARKVIDGLRAVPQGGLTMAEAVRSEAGQFERVAQIPCEVAFSLTRMLEADLRNHVLKIISEGLNNVAKHAEASQVWLRLSDGAAGLLVEIEDDGRGFDPSVQGEGKYGLLGISERVEMLQGHFSIDSHVGKGTRLQVEIPVREAGERND